MVKVLDLLRNYICLLKLPFLAYLSLNFSTRCPNMLSKFIAKSAQKASIFSSKANYARGLLTYILCCVLFVFPVFGEEPTITAEIDLYKALENRPLAGTITISHDEKMKIDMSSFQLEGKALQVSFVKNVKISPKDPLELSIYTFEIAGQPKGLQILPSISVMIDGKKYATTPSTYEVTGVQAQVRNDEARVPQKARLVLKGFVNGPPIVYPKQKMTFMYEIGFTGSIDLVAQSLPLLEAQGFKKIGDKKVVEGQEEGLSIQQIAQEVRTVEPGEYSFPVSFIEGYAYTESANQKKYYGPKLRAEASAINVVVTAFPQKGKPASFQGAVGQFTMKTSLLSPSKGTVGEKMSMLIAIGGDGDLTTVSLPDLSPLKSFFRLGDLPPVGEIKGNAKNFVVELYPLSSSVEEIPALEFSYLDIIANRYETIKSAPIPITVGSEEKEKVAKPIPVVPKPVPAVVQEKKEVKEEPPQMPENIKMPSVKEPEGIETFGSYLLSEEDLYNKRFGTWSVLWIIPILLILGLLGMPLKEYLEKKRDSIPHYRSDDLWQGWNRTGYDSNNYFSLLNRAFLARLQERKYIAKSDISLEELPRDGVSGKVGEFLMRLQEQRFTGELKQGNGEINREANKLWQEIV